MAKQIVQSGIINPTTSIEKLDYKLYTPEFKINMIPIHFLPYPIAFRVYESETKSLISTTLFSSVKVDDALENTLLKQGIFTYYKLSIPSSKYIKDPIRRIGQHRIDAICPAYGYVIETDIDMCIEYVYQLDFYNTRQVFKYNEEFSELPTT